MGRPVTAGEVEQAAAAGRRQLFVPPDAVIPTVTRERAVRLGVEIVRGRPQNGGAAVPPAAMGGAPTAAAAGTPTPPAARPDASPARPVVPPPRPAAPPPRPDASAPRPAAPPRPDASAPRPAAPPPRPDASPPRPAASAPPPQPAPAPPAPASSPPDPLQQVAPLVAPPSEPDPIVRAWSPASPTVVRTPLNAPIAPVVTPPPPLTQTPPPPPGVGVGPSTAADVPTTTGTPPAGPPAAGNPAPPPATNPVPGAPPIGAPVPMPTPRSGNGAAGNGRAAAAVPPPATEPAPPVGQASTPAPPLRPTPERAPTAPAAPLEIDPITIDLIENALRNARHEMDAVLFRTAMSPGIREQHDEFPLIANPDGKMVVGQFGSFIKGFLDNWKGTVEEGDIFLLNDPYSCAGAISHLNDWLVLLPIHYDHRLVGWASMFGHLTDVGGAVPSSMPIDARTIHSEGVVIRPFKLYKQGQLDEEALQFILDQVRLPEWNRSDLLGIVAACRVAERRVTEMCARFGAGTYLAVLDALLDRTYRAMQVLIQQNISTEPQSFEDYVDDDGQGYGPYKLKCTVWREGDKAIFDWSGTDPQSTAAINFYLNVEMFKMFVGVYLIMVFDPQILFNDGYYDLIEVRIPEGSLLKPRYPAALSGRTHALGRVFDVFGGALGRKTPQFMNAAGFSTSPHLMYSGYDDAGEWFQLYQIGFGGVPGRPIGDGLDGHSLWPEFTNVPNEYLESYFPLRIESYRCVPDSGGPGLHRGGCGIDMVYRFLADGEISIHDDRWLTHPWGVLGGKPAKRSTKYVITPDGRKIILPSKADHITVRKGDEFHFVTWGGGGWGDPLERDPEKVRLDVQRGLVTVRGAEEGYGVVVLDEGAAVDLEATAALRAQMRAERPPLKDFDFGPPIEELLARCKEETGLDPPQPPVFRSTAGGI